MPRCWEIAEGLWDGFSEIKFGLAIFVLSVCFSEAVELKDRISEMASMSGEIPF